MPQNSRQLRPRQKKEERFFIKKGQSRIKMGPKSAYACPYCFQDFSSLRILEIHMCSFHRKRRPIKDNKYDKADERPLEKEMVIILLSSS